jgi:16S rRNA (adenine1518-N6/adenine1519-N6)-dimethyltransferase
MDAGGGLSHPATLLKSLEQRAKKRFGQHFLASAGIVRNIVDVAQVGPGTSVMEIGPGLGILTEALLGSGATVTAVELDREMAAFIRERLPEVRLIETDAARLVFDQHLSGSGWRCVANLPYNAATRMITRMLERPDVFDRLVVMVQKEVAERLVAPAGDRKRGSLSVFTEARAEAKIRIRVPPGAFYPPPRVHSAVVELRMRPQPAIGDAPVEVFDAVVRGSFVQPRKTLRNNISATYSRVVADAAIADAGLDPTARPAVLTLQEFQKLAMSIHLFGA